MAAIRKILHRLEIVLLIFLNIKMEWGLLFKLLMRGKIQRQSNSLQERTRCTRLHQTTRILPLYKQLEDQEKKRITYLRLSICQIRNH
jgi:hypothetical protein